MLYKHHQQQEMFHKAKGNIYELQGTRLMVATLKKKHFSQHPHVFPTLIFIMFTCKVTFFNLVKHTDYSQCLLVTMGIDTNRILLVRSSAEAFDWIIIV